MKVHLYSAPQSTLLKFLKCSISEDDKVWFSPALVHVTFGLGLPVALQNRTAMLPSMIVVLEGVTKISGASTIENIESHIKLPINFYI